MNFCLSLFWIWVFCTRQKKKRNMGIYVRYVHLNFDRSRTHRSIYDLRGLIRCGPHCERLISDNWGGITFFIFVILLNIFLTLFSSSSSLLHPYPSFQFPSILYFSYQFSSLICKLKFYLVIYNNLYYFRWHNLLLS